MFETLLDVVTYGGIGLVLGWLGPNRPEKVSIFYEWLATKLKK